MKRSIITGAIAALVGMFPVAFLLALVWRFPIPFSAYESGLGGAVRSLLAVVFYGALGGFVLVPGLGAAAGAFAFQLSKGNALKAQKLSITLGVLCAFVGGVFLSVLDKIIGPW